MGMHPGLGLAEGVCAEDATAESIDTSGDLRLAICLRKANAPELSEEERLELIDVCLDHGFQHVVFKCTGEDAF